MLAYLRSYILREDVAPTYSEMQVALGLGSKSLVFRLVRALEERGAIRRLPNRNRSITLVDDALPADIEIAIAACAQETGLDRADIIEASLREFLNCPVPTRPVFDQRAAESLLRGRA